MIIVAGALRCIFFNAETRVMAAPLAQIVSGSRDKTVKLWNTLGECKYTIGEPDGHTEWVSCVRFSPVTTNPIIVSAGWDKLVKARLIMRGCKLCFRPCRHQHQYGVKVAARGTYKADA